MRGKRIAKKKRPSDKNIILTSVLVAMAAFIIYTLIVYTRNGWQWDGLFPYVLGVGGIEGVITGVLAIVDKRNNKEGNS